MPSGRLAGAGFPRQAREAASKVVPSQGRLRTRNVPPIAATRSFKAGQAKAACTFSAGARPPPLRIAGWKPRVLAQLKNRAREPGRFPADLGPKVPESGRHRCDHQRNLCLRCHYGQNAVDGAAPSPTTRLSSSLCRHTTRRDRSSAGRWTGVTLLLLCEPLVEGGWCDAGALAGQEHIAGHLRAERWR